MTSHVADVRNFERSGHFPMLDERPKFNRLLRDFLIAENMDSLAVKEEWRRHSR